ncbi:MAG: helix-turn-helix domain-containing protein [Treponema sp.]|nr:helix-turn-helix domain-containing protein [Treponema sp.]
MAVDYISIGKRIQTKRKSMGITQEKIAEEISVTVGYISQIERGFTKVNLDTLSKIAEVLNCDITTFLTGTVQNTPDYLYNDLNSSFRRLSTQNKKILLELSEVLLRNQ